MRVEGASLTETSGTVLALHYAAELRQVARSVLPFLFSLFIVVSVVVGIRVPHHDDLVLLVARIFTVVLAVVQSDFDHVSFLLFLLVGIQVDNFHDLGHQKISQSSEYKIE